MVWTVRPWLTMHSGYPSVFVHFVIRGSLDCAKAFAGEPVWLTWTDLVDWVPHIIHSNASFFILHVLYPRRI
jgi:hypothetical protein